MTGKAFFLQRLNDHVQYLNRIQRTLDGRGDFPGTDCHECALGHWLYGDGANEAAAVGDEAKQVFDGLLDPHERFHLASKRALDLQQSGDRSGSEQAITEMMKLSVVLVDNLIALDRLANR